jgi:hypothetical protein
MAQQDMVGVGVGLVQVAIMGLLLIRVEMVEQVLAHLVYLQEHPPQLRRVVVEWYKLLFLTHGVLH